MKIYMEDTGMNRERIRIFRTELDRQADTPLSDKEAGEVLVRLGSMGGWDCLGELEHTQTLLSLLRTSPKKSKLISLAEKERKLLAKLRLFIGMAMVEEEES